MHTFLHLTFSCAHTAMIDIPTQPPPSATPPGKPASVDGIQKEKYVRVLAVMKEMKELPVSDTDATPTPIAPSEQFWLTSECLLRYLRATKWDVDASVQRLRNTLVWRRTIGLGEGGKLTSDGHIRDEQLTGKQLILGYDNMCRPLW